MFGAYETRETARTDIRWRIGFKTCFENLVVQQDFSLRTFRVGAYDDDPRAYGFDLFRKYAHAQPLMPECASRLTVETIANA